MCHTSAGATVTDQAEHLSHISRSRVTDQVEPECQLSGGPDPLCAPGRIRTCDTRFRNAISAISLTCTIS